MYPHIINSYYTDTDSIFKKEPIDSRLIGKEKGKFKQEYRGMIKKAIFATPKLYILDTINQKAYSGVPTTPAPFFWMEPPSEGGAFFFLCKVNRPTPTHKYV